MNKNSIRGVALLLSIAAVAGIIVSFLLILEDVNSTAYTLFNYFPEKFGVTPSSTWAGAIRLGWFTSILQVVAMGVAFSPHSNHVSKWSAATMFVFACIFDNWTDVVFRSGYLAGRVDIATITTMAFYTFGSEFTESLSLIVLGGYWRRAITDLLWGWAAVTTGLSSIKGEWKHIFGEATNREHRDRNIHQSQQYSRNNIPGSIPRSKNYVPSHRPTYRPPVKNGGRDNDMERILAGLDDE